MSVQIENVGTYTFGNKTSTNNDMGMRDMQARAFEKRNSQYLLIKAPPACGKSRALMFLALDKLINQGIKKVIVSVPQMAIGASFKDTDLKSHGFFANWHVNNKYDLCGLGSDESKSETVLKFLDDPNECCLICAHPTLIYAFDKLKDKHKLDNTLIAVDEFHHVSADSGNRLGNVIRDLIKFTKAHIIAMTGSYFRGDSVPVLTPEDEDLFDKVTYTYYEQLQNYKYLKELSIDYAFYSGKWVDAIGEVLDTHKKTIIHIPSVNSNESTKDKYNEVSYIFDEIGEFIERDQSTGIYTIKTKDGRLLKVADLVNDNDGMQSVTLNALRKCTNKDDMDIIIALGMAKEGFDWPWCEVALTVGYRNSLTEVVQIIGRATRDCEGKSRAQFINLIRKPDALQDDVADAVNNLLKAITLSLLMEQVLVPNIHFRVASDGDSGTDSKSTIVIDDSAAPLSDNGKKVIHEDIPDLVTDLINSPEYISKGLVSEKGIDNRQIIDTVKTILLQKDLNLEPQDLDAIAQAVVIELNKNSIQKGSGSAFQSEDSQKEGDSESFDENLDNHSSPFAVKEGSNFIDKNKNRFINLDDFDINLIMEVNPFCGAYEFISKLVDAPTLHKIQDLAVSMRSEVTFDEARILWPKIKEFVQKNKREPNVNSYDDYEKRLAEVLSYIRIQKAKEL